jgi:hypothetical protein
MNFKNRSLFGKRVTLADEAISAVESGDGTPERQAMIKEFLDVP